MSTAPEPIKEEPVPLEAACPAQPLPVAPAVVEELQPESTDGSPASTPAPPPQDQGLILTGKKLWLVFGSMLLAVFVVALDQTILATALPTIASDFDAFSQQGWVSSAFILAQTPFLLIFGQILRIWPAKYVLLGAVVVFEIGSAICGAAQGVYVLIFGRALSGVGAAGIFIAFFQVIAQVTKLESRPKLFGAISVVFAIASVAGPLVGGVFTDQVTWRWCFFINLPIGAVTLVAVTFLLKAAPPLGSDPAKRDLRSRLQLTARMDWVAGTAILGAVTCLVLALQWGGNTKPWSSGAVIATLVVSVALFAATIFWESWLDERAMVPPALFDGGVRAAASVVAIIAYAFTTRFMMMIFTYYIPVYYQISRDYSAVKSGTAILPFMIATVVTSFAGGRIISRWGRYWPFLVLGPVCNAVGSGLMYTINEHTSSAKLIGYQIILGVAAGTSTQNPVLAMQAEFRDRHKFVGQAVGMASFGQILGGTIGLAVAEAAFASQLSMNLAKFAPSVDPTVVEQSPTNVYTQIPADQLANVIKAYCTSLDLVFLLGVPFAIVSLVLVAGIRNIDLRAKRPQDGDEEKRGDGLELEDKDKEAGDALAPVGH